MTYRWELLSFSRLPPRLSPGGANLRSMLLTLSVGQRHYHDARVRAGRLDALSFWRATRTPHWRVVPLGGNATARPKRRTATVRAQKHALFHSLHWCHCLASWPGRLPPPIPYIRLGMLPLCAILGLALW